MEKRRNCGSNFSSFPQYFQYISNLGVQLHIHLRNVVVRVIFSSILQFWYIEVRISRSISKSLLNFEITRVDCNWQNTYVYIKWRISKKARLRLCSFCVLCFQRRPLQIFNPRRGRQHSFVEIDHEIFSTVILSLPLIQEGQLSVSGERMCTILVNRLED